MSATERSEFKEKLNDEGFKNEFNEYQAFIVEVQESINYGETKKRLDKIHQDLYPIKKAFYLRPSFYVIASIAACFILFVMIDPNLYGDKTMSEDNSYVELTNDEENAESSDDAIDLYEMPEYPSDIIIIDSLIKQVQTVPIGTSFLISEDGIFITSKHLVKNRDVVTLQNKDSELTFQAEVIYTDTLMDFAILQCHENLLSNFARIPFKFNGSNTELGEEVFTLGYPKKDIVYTKGDISSENGYKSDSLYIEISMAANPGYSGAPLFNKDGHLVGIITANNSRKQLVTYALKHQYIKDLISELREKEIIDINMKRNYTKKYKTRSKMIQSYRSFIFEVH